MDTCIRYLNNRIIAEGPMIGLRKELIEVWGWKPRKDDTFNVEDTYVNRLILGLPIERPEYVAQNAVDGLLDFQRGDVQKLAKYGNMLNANAMGLGKTIEAIATLKTNNWTRAVVFTPKSCITQWATALQDWFPELRVFCFASTSNKLPILDNIDIVVTNYEKIQGRKEVRKTTTGVPKKVTTLSSFGEWLCRRRWDAIILDEVHLVKNHQGIRHKLLQRLPRQCTIGMSGTPITRYADDLYGVFHIIDPKSVGSSYWTFVDYFCEVEDGFWGRKVTGLTNNPKKLEVLWRLWDLLTVHHTMEEVLKDFPEIVEERILVDMEPKQRKVYKDVVKLVLDDLPENCTVQNGMMKAIRMQQITTCPKLFEGLDWGPKFEFIGDWLENEPELKVLIGSPYERHIHLLHDYLQGRGIECVMYSGKLSDKAREASINSFKESGARVICATIGAIGTGTDGLQYSCNTVLMLDRSWGPEEMRQFISRIRRYGQSKTVQVFYLECAQSSDQRIGRTAIAKLSDIRKIVSGEGYQEVSKNDYRLF